MMRPLQLYFVECVGVSKVILHKELSFLVGQIHVAYHSTPNTETRNKLSCTIRIQGKLLSFQLCRMVYSHKGLI